MSQKEIEKEKDNMIPDGEQPDKKADEPKKQIWIVRVGKAVRTKYLEFKAHPVGKWVVRGGKVLGGAGILYETFQLGKRSNDSAVFITEGDVTTDETEIEAPVDEPDENEVNEEHD